MSEINDKDEKDKRFLEEGDEYFKDPPEPDLGDSVHPKTVEAYKVLDKQVPDSPRLATLRPQEKLEKNIKNRGLDPKAKYQITKIYRVRNKKGEEFLAHDLFKTIEDYYGNTTRPNQYRYGRYIIPIGDRRNDANFNALPSEVKEKVQEFDIPWSTKEFDKLIAKHVKSGFVVNDIQLLVGEASNKTNSVFSGKSYAIRNIDDFKNGKFEDLMTLGKRALSDQEPSLHKLSQPVEEDPANSLMKKGKMG